MKSRLRSLERILDVQKKLHRLAEWKLADLQNQEAALRRRQQDLVRFLDGDGALPGAFATIVLRHLRTLAESNERVASEKNAQIARVLVELQRVGSAERAVDHLEKDLRRAEDKRELAEMIEAMIHRGDASLP
jgi:hypothetical protein